MGRLMRRPGRFSHDFMRRLSPDPSAAPSAALHSCGGRTHRSVLVPVDTTGCQNRTTLLSQMRGSAGRPSCECCSYVLHAQLALIRLVSCFISASATLVLLIEGSQIST